MRRHILAALGKYEVGVRSLHRGLRPFASAAPAAESSSQTPPGALNLRSRPFTRPTPASDYTSLPSDTNPNPLFGMTSAEIMALSSSEYLHMIQIPPRNTNEQDQFCVNLIHLIGEHILVRPELVSLWLLRRTENYPHNEAVDMVVSTLRESFKNNSVKSSILEYIVAPESERFRQGFFHNISTLLHMREKPTEEKATLLLSYLTKLAATRVTNPRPVLLKTSLYAKIIHTVPPPRFAELYSCLLHINIQTHDITRLEKLKKTLMRGTETERFVARTGWLSPKWHHTLTTTFGDAHKSKMVHFFSVNDLAHFTDYFVRKNDIVNANVYLNLMVQKFEEKCAVAHELHHNQQGVSRFEDDLHTVLRTILNHVMTFKGPRNCVQVLRYMIKARLEVRFEMLLVIIKKLRAHKHYQEALLLINNVDLNRLARDHRVQLVEEILVLIKARYPRSPKILVGYIASMFKGNGDHNTGLELLNSLGLLGITHGNGQIGPVSSYSMIQHASVDRRLTGFELSANTLANVYETVLDSVDRPQLTTEFIEQLYSRYVAAKTNAGAKENAPAGVFENDRVVANLITYLLHENPHANAWGVKESQARFELAKHIFEDYYTHFYMPRSKRTTSVSDVLIHTSLMVHKDYKFAAKVIKSSRDAHVPFTFNQIFPFIKFHYGRKEYKAAELWYQELVKHSVPATVQPAKELFRIARELKWDVNGFAYRKLTIHKNHRAREQLNKIKTDPLVFLGDEDTEDLVTEELIGMPDTQTVADSNFADELASLLYKVK